MVTIQGKVSAQLLRFPVQMNIVDSQGEQFQTQTDRQGYYQLSAAMMPPLVIEASEAVLDDEQCRGIRLCAFCEGGFGDLYDEWIIHLNPLTELLVSDMAVALGFPGPVQLMKHFASCQHQCSKLYRKTRAYFYQGFARALAQVGLPEDFDPVHYDACWQPLFDQLVNIIWVNRNYDSASGQSGNTILTDLYFTPIAVPDVYGDVPVFDLERLRQRKVRMDQADVRILLVGDSTASSYAPLVAPQTGWGQQLEQWFDDSKVMVINAAKPGRSSRSYRHEGWFRYLKSLAKAGDYLLIQMGHNDEKADASLEGRGTYDVANLATYPNTPQSVCQCPPEHPELSFQYSLEFYLEQARQFELIPVLLTPTTRVLNAQGQMGFPVVHGHSTFQNAQKGYAFVGNYSQTVKDTATENDVAVLDIESATIDLVNRLGESSWKDYWLAVDPVRYPHYLNRVGCWDLPDTTHFQIKGAYAVSELVANAICHHPALSELSRMMKAS
ncbi:MAG: hypothetical protein CENE_00799 [Candidatus Celerinatantimonas neptuna]|nr:MAG: hypothetical protein CENE_00799 [Candidatus Celerinatantimonas neptuna]